MLSGHTGALPYRREQYPQYCQSRLAHCCTGWLAVGIMSEGLQELHA